MPTFTSGTPYEVYAAMPGGRWSIIKHFKHSPRHAYHALATIGRTTAQQKMLQVIHACVLTPESEDAQWAVWPGKQRRGAAFDQWVAENPGVTPLTKREGDMVKRASDAIRTHPEARELLAAARHTEFNVYWKDPVSGVQMKCRLDLLTVDDILVDLKTLGTTAPRLVIQRVMDQMIHAQLDHYAVGLEQNGVNVRERRLIVAEGVGAHDVAVFRFDDAFNALAAQDRAALTAKYVEALSDSHWPWRFPKVEDLAPPDWAYGPIVFDEGSLEVPDSMPYLLAMDASLAEVP